MNHMPLIELEGMHFRAHHGCFAEERNVGGHYVVHLAMRADAPQALLTDSIDEALNYQQAYQVVDEQMRISSHLIEHVAQRILEALFAQLPRLAWASVKIQKLNPPMGGKVHCSSVTLERARHGHS